MVILTWQILKVFRPQKIIQSHHCFSLTIDPPIMRKWFIEYLLDPVICLHCKQPDEQRHILLGRTSFLQQMLKCVVITCIFILLSKVQSDRGGEAGAKYLPQKFLGIWVKPWVVLDVILLGSFLFFLFFQDIREHSVGDSHFSSCTAMAKQGCAAPAY